MAKGQLFPEREKLLRMVGFGLFHLHTKWNTMLVALREYKPEYKDCNVPTDCSHSPKLGSWVNTQRQALKRGKLSPERIKLPDDLGFRW
jgi:hypothetical protein